MKPNPQILLVDTDSSDVKVVREVLGTAGLEIHVRTSASSALVAFHALEPDLVLVDSEVPGTSGSAVTREIKNTDRGKSTPVILLAKGPIEESQRAQTLSASGCSMLLQKPLMPQDLLDTLSRFLPGAFIGTKETSAPKAKGSGTRRAAGVMRDPGTPFTADSFDEESLGALLDQVFPSSDTGGLAHTIRTRKPSATTDADAPAAGTATTAGPAPAPRNAGPLASTPAHTASIQPTPPVEVSASDIVADYLANDDAVVSEVDAPTGLTVKDDEALDRVFGGSQPTITDESEIEPLESETPTAAASTRVIEPAKTSIPAAKPPYEAPSPAPTMSLEGAGLDFDFDDEDAPSPGGVWQQLDAALPHPIDESPEKAAPVSATKPTGAPAPSSARAATGAPVPTGAPAPTISPASAGAPAPTIAPAPAGTSAASGSPMSIPVSSETESRSDFAASPAPEMTPETTPLAAPGAPVSYPTPVARPDTPEIPTIPLAHTSPSDTARASARSSESRRSKKAKKARERQQDGHQETIPLSGAGTDAAPVASMRPLPVSESLAASSANASAMSDALPVDVRQELPVDDFHVPSKARRGGSIAFIAAGIAIAAALGAYFIINRSGDSDLQPAGAAGRSRTPSSHAAIKNENSSEAPPATEEGLDREALPPVIPSSDGTETAPGSTVAAPATLHAETPGKMPAAAHPATLPSTRPGKPGAEASTRPQASAAHAPGASPTLTAHPAASSATIPSPAPPAPAPAPAPSIARPVEAPAGIPPATGNTNPPPAEAVPAPAPSEPPAEHHEPPVPAPAQDVHPPEPGAQEPPPETPPPPVGQVALGETRPAPTVETQPTPESEPVVQLTSPVPVSRTAPVYPQAALAMRASGTVGLLVKVEADGSVSDVKVIRPASPSLNTAAVAAVRHWSYRPAHRGVEAVAAWIEETVVFQLK